MIKVAFMGNFSKEWMGGVNYLSNLFYAISLLKNKNIHPIVFLGQKADQDIIQKFLPHAQIVQDSLFDRKSFKWFASKVMEKVFLSNVFKVRILNKYDISVISHSDITRGYDTFAIINWIPDFQHLCLPDFFSDLECRRRDEKFMDFFQKSEIVVVSSHDAYRDANIFAPDLIEKVRILQFVSQPNRKIFDLDQTHLKRLEGQYGFKGNFFYLPNQFWKHKNHAIVFEAVKLLKDQGVNVLIVCTGYLRDYRNPEYIQGLQDYVIQNKLQDNIKILGLVDYQDVLFFMRYSVAVINPSFFEGWSSTVEECKSIGKNMILSDIPIHKEQNPPESIYFDPHDAQELSEAIKVIWLYDSPGPSRRLEGLAENTLKKRTLSFANTYQVIVEESISIVM